MPSAYVKIQYITRNGNKSTINRSFQVKQQSDVLLQTEVTKAIRSQGGSEPVILDIKWR